MAKGDAEVAVVGAGLAGLTAARSQAGRSVVVLEARDRVGGRVCNLDLGDGKAVELGATWIGPTQDRMYALTGELGLETFPTYVEGKSRLLLEGECDTHPGDLPPMNPFVLADLVQGLMRVGRLAKRVGMEAPWEAPQAEEWDRRSLADWLGRRRRASRRCGLRSS